MHTPQNGHPSTKSCSSDVSNSGRPRIRGCDLICQQVIRAETPVTGNSEISLSKVARVNGAAPRSGSILRNSRLAEYPLTQLSTAIIVIIGLLVLPPIWTLIRTSFANTMPDLSTAG